MGNPNNTSILVGRVTNEPKFIKNRHGQEFSCRFVLAVSRNYKCSDGSTKADFLPASSAWSWPTGSRRGTAWF